LGECDRIKRYNRDAVGAILKKASEKLNIVAKDTEENKKSQGPEIEIKYMTKPLQPPHIPPPPKAKMLSLPKTKTSMRPL
jgi:hypothetical protein